MVITRLAFSRMPEGLREAFPSFQSRLRSVHQSGLRGHWPMPRLLVVRCQAALLLRLEFRNGK